MPNTGKDQRGGERAIKLNKDRVPVLKVRQIGNKHKQQFEHAARVPR